MKVYLTTNIDNSSLQTGDDAFYCDVEVLNGSQPINSDDAVALGSITEIGPDWIEVQNDVEIEDGAFLLFQKSAIINDTGLRGHYMSVTMSNDTAEKAELFAISSEVTESSK